jgi:hypothetical protein
MGEIAEMMLNGFYCEQCGSLIDGEEPGYPRKCEDCEKESRPHKHKKRGKKVRQNGKH